ncbi:Ubiquinone biosynthesis protein coq9, mitochondrial [Neopestalotiopsis sp. 37M]|nr:Ubiquinone biosynthesis protein coq9, mitochondrial [Neopestalotiopsis sp. 37M]
MAPSRAFTRLILAQQRRATTQCAARTLRGYHSYDHPSPPGAFNAAERAILSAAYAHVPEHGFTQHALALGARDAGYLDISASLLPNGPFSLIKYHLVTKRESLAPKSAQIFGPGTEAERLPVDDKVERLTWERLLENRDVIHRWQEALAVMAQPSLVPSSLHELALLSDEIYHLSGDKAVDPTWYTKRASLSTIYASTELFMTNDRSFGYDDTRAFLQRRLQENSGLGAVVSNIGQWVGFTAAAGVNVLRSKGMRI